MHLMVDQLSTNSGLVLRKDMRPRHSICSNQSENSRYPRSIRLGDNNSEDWLQDSVKPRFYDSKHESGSIINEDELTDSLMEGQPTALVLNSRKYSGLLGKYIAVDMKQLNKESRLSM